MNDNEKKLTAALVAIEIHLKDATSKLKEVGFNPDRSGLGDRLAISAMADIGFSRHLAKTVLEETNGQ